MLFDLTGLENRPDYLTEAAYEWCSAICENYKSLEDERLLPLALKIGFRHFDPQDWWIPVTLNHTEHYRELIDIIFKGGDGEAIADLLCAWASRGVSHDPAWTLLDLCTGHLVDLPNRMDLSLRLRRLVIRSIENIGYEGFEGGGMEKFVELLNYLHVRSEDMDNNYKWTLILLETIQSSEGAQHLSVQSWELLVELMILNPGELGGSEYDPEITVSLLEGQEWDKLECWMGIVWMAWPTQTGTTTEDVERATALLFRQRPGAIQKLAEQMERRSTSGNGGVPEAFRRICGRPHETASRFGAP